MRLEEVKGADVDNTYRDDKQVVNYAENERGNPLNLIRAYEALAIKPFIKPSRVTGTRWLPHTERTLEAFWTGCTVIRTHLDQNFQ
ncbi:uncharacterized protein LOC132559895 [Ylistrum balloti]|uniref:uncharacterized protein LOC132559895 n=1 Tax=Ylistrum balloti TaxID=509963 RepID=UPI0029059CCE|nr:uncharacterized protein LOC132559895 [Ylistrum balloti]